MRFPTPYLAALLLALLAVAPRAAADEDERLIAGLRQRQLFALANAFCLDRLQDPRLTEAQRARLVIEGMLTASQQAIYSPLDQRSQHWQTAQQLAEKIAPEHPYRLVVELQQALLTLAQGELLRQDAEATENNAAAMKGALELLRKAQRELEALAQKIAQQGDLPPPDGLSPEDWSSLRSDVQSQLARSEREQALCYPAASSERITTLKRAQERLAKLRPQLRDESPLSWRVKVELATNARLLGEEASAIRMFEALLAPPTPRPIQDQARAEFARLKLNAGQLLDAYNLLIAARTSPTEPAAAELEYAVLEARVAQWKAALIDKDAANAARFRDDIDAQLALLERTFGPYWARRGEALVGVNAGSGGAELQTKTRLADARFAKGEFDDETTKLYDQAADLAKRAQDYGKYLELAARAATVTERRQEPALAAWRCWKAATTLAELLPMNDPLQAQASDLHLRGLKLVEGVDPGGMIKKYQEHLRHWPQAKSAGEVQFLLGTAYEQEALWPQAFQAYQQVPATHERGAAASQRAATLWLPYLATLSDKPKERLAENERATAYLRGLLGDPPPPTYTDLQRVAALTLARLLLQDPASGAAGAQQQIEAALQGSPLADTAWRNEAQSLLVVALVAQPKQSAAAAKLLAKLANEDPRRLLDVLTLLIAPPLNAQPELARSLAKQSLEAIALLKPKQNRLSTTQRATLALLEAATLAAAGERESSLTAYAALLKAQPRNATVLEGYAMVLAQSGEQAALEQARNQWQIVAETSPPKSERWWRAKYHIALLTHRLGDNARAAQLIREVEQAAGGLSKTPLEKEFQALKIKVQ